MGRSKKPKAARLPRAAPATLDLPAAVGTFDLLDSGVDDDLTAFGRWRSRETGLTIVWANKVSAFISTRVIVATEPDEEFDTAHVLEHLVLCGGSRRRPYSDFLLDLAGLALTDPVGGVTYTACTEYHSSTLGEEGYRAWLPAFLETILDPALLESKFKTEVYSMTGEGNEIGVVMCENRTYETAGSHIERELGAHLYPPESALHRGHVHDAAGLARLTIDRVRAYHTRFYDPRNITVIVEGGSVDPTTVLQLLDEASKNAGLARHQRADQWIRPWVDTPTARNPPDFSQPRHVEAAYPATSDSSPLYTVAAWLGPAIDDLSEQKALRALFFYLQLTGHLPVGVHLDLRVRNPMVIQLHLTSAQGQSDVGELVAELAKATARFDLLKMRDALDQSRNRFAMLRLADTVEASFGEAVIRHAIFTPDSAVQTAIFARHWDRSLYHLQAHDWIELIHRYFLDSHPTVVICRPSVALALQQTNEDALRRATIASTLGNAGLKRLGEELELAKARNRQQCSPAELLRAIPVAAWPAAGSSRGLLARTGLSTVGPPSGLQAYIDKDDASRTLTTPLWFAQTDEPLITIHAWLLCDDRTVKAALLPFFSEQLRDGTVFDPDSQVWIDDLEATTLRRRDLAWFNVKMVGASGHSRRLRAGEVLRVGLAAEPKKYPLAVAWLSRVLHHGWFSEHTLRVTADKLKKYAVGFSYEPETVAQEGLVDLGVAPESVMGSTSMLHLVEASREARDRLDGQPSAFLRDFEELVNAMRRPSSIRVLIKGDILRLPTPVSTWERHFQPRYSLNSPLPSPPPLVDENARWERLSALGRDPAVTLRLRIMSNASSCFAYHATRLTMAYDHADRATLEVALAILDGYEGLIGRSVREQGFAYSCSLTYEAALEWLVFRVFSAEDCFATFRAAKDCVQDLIHGTLVDKVRVEVGKRRALKQVLAHLVDDAHAAEFAFLTEVVLSRPADATETLAMRIAQVSVSDVRRVMAAFIAPVFDPARSIASVVIPPALAAQVRSSYKREGFRVIADTFAGFGQE